MTLIPNEIRGTLPDLYSQEQEQDPVVQCKFMTRDGRFAWFLTEYSHEDGDTCFGWMVTDGEGELGTFSLRNLQDRIAEMFLEVHDDQGTKGVHIFGDRIPKVLRDETFEPMRLSAVKRLLEERE